MLVRLKSSRFLRSPPQNFKIMAETKEDVVEGGSIKLTSKDQESIDIEKKFAFISKLVKTSLDTDTTSTEVPIPGVAADILQLVCDYMNHHQGVEPACIESPLRSKLMKDVCKDAWDADYIDQIGDNRQQLYDLILVNFSS